jgi:hypothetical protein
MTQRRMPCSALRAPRREGREGQRCTAEIPGTLGLGRMRPAGLGITHISRADVLRYRI